MKTYFSGPVIMQFLKVLLMLLLILVGVKSLVGFVASGEWKLNGAAIDIMYWLLIPISLVITYVHVKTLKSLGISEVLNSHLMLKQNGTFQSTLTKAELIQKLKTNPFFRQMKISETETGVVLKSGATWTSWGELVFIAVNPKGNGISEIQVESKPLVFTTLFDTGKNLENVVRMERMVC